jgi:hypothetical protein
MSVTAPADLQKEGKKLWREITTEFDLTHAELALLREACRLVDELQTIRFALLKADATVSGSTGQVRPNPLFDEARKHRESLAKTLGALALPDEEQEKGMTPTQKRAKAAADARWNMQRERESRRFGVVNGTA